MEQSWHDSLRHVFHLSYFNIFSCFCFGSAYTHFVAAFSTELNKISLLPLLQNYTRHQKEVSFSSYWIYIHRRHYSFEKTVPYKKISEIFNKIKCILYILFLPRVNILQRHPASMANNCNILAAERYVYLYVYIFLYISMSMYF